MGSCWTGTGSSGAALSSGLAGLWEVRDVETMKISSGSVLGVGPGTPIVRLSIRAAVRIWLWSRAVVPDAEALLPVGLGSCADLYVAVRRIGGTVGPVHRHIADGVGVTAQIR